MKNKFISKSTMLITLASTLLISVSFLNTKTELEPAPPKNTSQKISLGKNNSALLTEDGRMFTWGINIRGQLGDGTTTKKNTPTEITNKFKFDNELVDLTNSQISIGRNHSSLLTEDGKLFMWGLNANGQLGEGTTTKKTKPTEITENFVDEEDKQIDLTESKISMGGNHSSLLTNDGRMFMWGDNEFGQLGNEQNDDQRKPIEITEYFLDEEDQKIDLSNSQISLGEYHSSLLTEDGKLFMWGLNNSGQLGNGAENNKNTPLDITKKIVNEDGEQIDLANGQISMGENHSSLLTQDGKLFMWGDNEFGQLGDETEDDKTEPLDITNKFVDEEEKQIDLSEAHISMGEYHSSLLTEDGRMFMWGLGDAGQLGNGTNENKNTPIEITNNFVEQVEDEEELIDLTNSEFSLGGNHSSLLTNDGRIFMWGRNTEGQLGSGGENWKDIPKEIEI